MARVVPSWTWNKTAFSFAFMPELARFMSGLFSVGERRCVRPPAQGDPGALASPKENCRGRTCGGEGSKIT